MPRIVQCPKCRSLLQEPPPGNPIYQCGSCSTTLQAKHATQAELEASKRRISADQPNRNSFSDSSSGEILSDRVVDEFPGLGNGNESPVQRRDVPKSSGETVERKSSSDLASEKGSCVTDTQVVTNQQPGQTQVLDPCVQSSKAQELDMKQLALDPMSGAEYLQGTAQLENESSERWPSTSDAPHENSLLQDQRNQVRSHTEEISASQYQMTSSAIREYGTSDTFRSNSRINGTLSVAEMQSQLSHLHHAHSGLSSESVQVTGHSHHQNPGREQNYESDAGNVQNIPMGEGNILPGASRTKLKWQAREPDSAGEASLPKAASSKGLGEDDPIAHDDMQDSVSVKQTTSVEYVVESNWRSLGSRRRSLNEDGRRLDEQGAEGQQLVRSPSDGSDKTFDMYENPASVGDYEPSENSSTTMDEVEINEGNGSGRLSGEMGRYSPPLDPGITRSLSRPNLPRSNASSGRSAFSEEGSSYSSQTEMASPENHLASARMTVAARRHSWDERVSRMGAIAASNSGPQGPVSVRQKSISQDYGNGRPEHLHRVASDPGGNYRGDQLQGNQAAISDSYRQPQPSALRPSSQPNYQQQQWVNRYVPPPQHAQRSPSLQQWSPNSPSRSYFPEPSPLHQSQSRPSYISRQMPAHLPPKQGHYPLLPPPGALPHVLCQQCGILLAVPLNLPPTKKITQKLRCGSCMKISIFSVRQAEGSSPVPVPYFTRPDTQRGQPLLASSPDSQAEFSSTYRSATQSGVAEIPRRRVTVSDLREKQIQTPLPRKHSLDSEDLVAAEQEMVERALSGRVENLMIDSYPKSGSSVQSSTSVVSETVITSNFSEASSGTALFPQNRGGPDPRFTKNGQGANAGGNVAAEEKRHHDVILTSSDSESDLTQRSLSASNSPQLNQSSSWASPDPNNSTLQDSRSLGRATEHAATEQMQEARGLNKALKGIFGMRRSRLTSASGHYRRKVVVNGVQIPDHLVKKAEDQAGPIHPGSYWYDGQAGFWGVAGSQCLGIIPPFIEEFNYPMSKDCSGGRTGIFVNGRELHHMDREKLSRRGLPDTPGLSYRVEISGRVIEEAMGSELRGLGRLAPSLELKGRGTGMYVPSNIGGGSRS